MPGNKSKEQEFSPSLTTPPLPIWHQTLDQKWKNVWLSFVGDQFLTAFMLGNTFLFSVLLWSTSFHISGLN